MTKDLAPSRQSAIRRTELRQTPRRRGAMLVVALACLAIVMAIIGVMLQGALRAPRPRVAGKPSAEHASLR